MEKSIKQCSSPQCPLKGVTFIMEGMKDENWPLSEFRGDEWVFRVEQMDSV